MSVERLLIVGIDTVVGANLAAHLADRFHVIGLSAGEEVAIEGCETALAPVADVHAVRQAIALYRPDQIVVCQAAGDSSWLAAGERSVAAQSLAATRAWIEAAHAAAKRITLISADAVFTGPWMFHTETCDSLCPVGEAQALRALEQAALADSTSLIVRTHPYGWSPQLDGGWIDGVLSALEADERPVFDCVAHATPILATDLADVLASAWAANLTGLYHIAGSERTNPHQFACAVARIFDLDPPASVWIAPTGSPPTGFARGETSLHTRSIRRTLGIGLPMLAEGLERLRAQHDQGFDRRFSRGKGFAPSKVA